MHLTNYTYKYFRSSIYIYIFPKYKHYSCSATGWQRTTCRLRPRREVLPAALLLPPAFPPLLWPPCSMKLPPLPGARGAASGTAEPARSCGRALRRASADGPPPPIVAPPVVPPTWVVGPMGSVLLVLPPRGPRGAAAAGCAPAQNLIQAHHSHQLGSPNQAFTDRFEPHKRSSRVKCVCRMHKSS